MLTNENKKQILKSFLQTVAGIADKSYQTRIWIRGEGPEVDNFDETCCHFSNIGDPIIQDYQDYGLNQNQYQILKEFRDRFEAFSDENDWPPEFIDTPEWAQIMAMAKEVLKAFNYKRGL